MNNVVGLGRVPRLIPGRLREAREAKELTMTELGSLVGMTRQAISFYEAGEREPDPETLMRVVDALGQPIFYFTTDRPDAFGERGTTFFRSFKSKTKRTNKKCEVLSNWFAESASYFNEYVNLPEVKLPEIAAPKDGSRYTGDEIESAATQCRRAWGLGDGPISDVVALLESKGVIVARAEFGADSVSAFSFWEGARPFIFLGADKSSACRSRFDAAHELGHLVLHHGVAEDELEIDLGRIEKEADRFASSFLLPAATFPLEVFSTRLAAFVELKKRWKVSVAAQIYRCSYLGVLSEDQVLNLRKQLSANRWRKTEPLDDVIPVEKPTVMAKSLQLLLDTRAKSVADILGGIRLARQTLKSLLGASLPPSSIDQPPTAVVRLKT